MAKVKPVHYVDNEKFLKEMIIYKRGFDEAKEKGELPPMISEYLGECFMKIAQRLSFRPNFINYAFKDDMISDGIENCIQYIKNFNPEKSSFQNFDEPGWRGRVAKQLYVTKSKKSVHFHRK